MQSDSGTQFARAFGPEEIPLKSGTDAVLYANFAPLDRDFVVGYSQSVKGRKRKTGNLVVGSHFDELELLELFDDVRERYDLDDEAAVAVDALHERVLAYARLVPHVFSVDEIFINIDDFCACHDRGLDYGIRGFYGPAMESGGEESLAIEIHRGCELIDSFYGDPREGGAKALELVDRALASSEEEFAVKSIDRFRRSLLRVLPADAS